MIRKYADNQVQTFAVALIFLNFILIIDSRNARLTNCITSPSTSYNKKYFDYDCPNEKVVNRVYCIHKECKIKRFECCDISYYDNSVALKKNCNYYYDKHPKDNVNIMVGVDCENSDCNRWQAKYCQFEKVALSEIGRKGPEKFENHNGVMSLNSGCDEGQVYTRISWESFWGIRILGGLHMKAECKTIIETKPCTEGRTGERCEHCLKSNVPVKLKGCNFEACFSLNDKNELSLIVVEENPTYDCTEILFENINIQLIDAGMFKAFTNLKKLTFSGGHFNLNGFNFNNLQHLTELKFYNNQLSVLPDYVFQRLTSLKALYIEYNNITNIKPTAFFGLETLTELHMEGNAVNLDLQVFTYIPQLKVLDIPENEIDQIESKLFFSLKNLTELNIENNYLKSFDEDAFAGLQHLKELNLQSNSFTRIPVGLFRDFPDDVNIKMDQQSKCSIYYFSIINKELSKKPNSDLTKCTHLDLSNYKLSSLSYDLFQYASNLKTLDLSNNELQNLNNPIFHGLESIESIDLTSNNIKTIDFDNLGSKKLNPKIKISNNNMDCCTEFHIIEKGVYRSGRDFVFDCIGVNTKGLLTSSTEVFQNLRHNDKVLINNVCSDCSQSNLYNFDPVSKKCHECKVQLECIYGKQKNECVSGSINKKKCTECDTKYELVLDSNGLCVPCPVDTFYSNGDCKPCAFDRSRFIGKDGECKKCTKQSHCLDETLDIRNCVKGKLSCFKCDKGYGLYNGLCEFCTDKGEYYDVKTKLCMPCGSSKLHYLNSNGRCFEAKKQPFCATMVHPLQSNTLGKLKCQTCTDEMIVGQDGLCEKCKLGEFYSENSCVPCANDPKKTINEKGECIACKRQGYCAVEGNHCLEESQYLNCEQCDRRYSVNDVGYCEKCKKTDYYNENNYTCIDCKRELGLYLYKELCYKCVSQPHCIEDGSSCLSNTDITQLVCKTCSSHKEKVINTDGICSNCPKNKYYSNGKCYACLESQKDCEIDDEECVVIDEKIKRKCRQCLPSLEVILNESGVCSPCLPGQYYHDNNCYDCHGGPEDRELNDNNECIEKLVQKESVNKEALLIGAVCACVVGVLAVVLLVGWWVQYKRKKKIEKIAERELLNGLTPEEFVMGTNSMRLQSDDEYMALHNSMYDDQIVVPSFFHNHNNEFNSTTYLNNNNTDMYITIEHSKPIVYAETENQEEIIEFDNNHLYDDSKKLNINDSDHIQGSVTLSKCGSELTYSSLKSCSIVDEEQIVKSLSEPTANKEVDKNLNDNNNSNDILYSKLSYSKSTVVSRPKKNNIVSNSVLLQPSHSFNQESEDDSIYEYSSPAPSSGSSMSLPRTETRRKKYTMSGAGSSPLSISGVESRSGAGSRYGVGSITESMSSRSGEIEYAAPTTEPEVDYAAPSFDDLHEHTPEYANASVDDNENDKEVKYVELNFNK